jgi:hypothetical protein
MVRIWFTFQKSVVAAAQVEMFGCRAVDVGGEEGGNRLCLNELERKAAALVTKLETSPKLFSSLDPGKGS